MTEAEKLILISVTSHMLLKCNLQLLDVDTVENLYSVLAYFIEALKIMTDNAEFHKQNTCHDNK
jgi:hypothetical protein